MKLWMRTCGAIVLVLPLLAVTAAPAYAHTCTVGTEIPVGKPTTVDVGVTVENEPAKDLSVLLPKGLRVDSVVENKGWSATQGPSEIRFRGGPFAPTTCGHLSIRVVASKRGVYPLPVYQHMPDGSMQRFPNANDLIMTPDGRTVSPTRGDAPNPDFEQVLYAGVPLGTTSVSSKAGTPWLPIIAVVDLALVALLLVPYMIRRRSRARSQSGKEPSAIE